MTDAPKLRDSWYRLDARPGVDLDQPGIIEWRVEGHGIEIGKATRISDRIDDAAGNLRDMVAGNDYHIEGSDFRAVHYALLAAYQQQTPTTLAVLETCARDVLTTRRRYWLERRRAEERAGGPKVLNTR